MLKYIQSNKKHLLAELRHKRLARKKNKKRHLQLADYHKDVRLHQNEEKRVLNKSQKRRLFRISKYY